MAASICAIFFLMLTGCTNQSMYRPASHSGYGYQETTISDERYRVHFKARGDNRIKAMDFALLRAAELTHRQGFDWFIVVSRDTLIDRENASPRSSISARSGHTTTRSCGLLGCTTQSKPSTQMGIGLSFGDSNREIESILEIKMGRGVRPEQIDSYEARDIIDNLYRNYELDR